MTFDYEDVKEIIVTKDRELIVKFKRTETSEKIKKHLLKQEAGEPLE